MANHIVIVLHGIECNPSDTLWSEELTWRLAVRCPDLEIYPRKYGYVSGSSVWWNWGFRRDRIVDHEAYFFRRVQADRGTDAKISVICHSLGGYIVHKLLDRGFRFHRIIELYGAGDENQDWSVIENGFDRFYVWYSSNDEVLPKSNFGQIGLVGPTNPHSKVIPIQTTEGHTTFMEDAVMYSRLDTWKHQLED